MLFQWQSDTVHAAHPLALWPWSGLILSSLVTMSQYQTLSFVHGQDWYYLVLWPWVNIRLCPLSMQSPQDKLKATFSAVTLSPSHTSAFSRRHSQGYFQCCDPVTITHLSIQQETFSRLSSLQCRKPRDSHSSLSHRETIPTSLRLSVCDNSTLSTTLPSIARPHSATIHRFPDRGHWIKNCLEQWGERVFPEK